MYEKLGISKKTIELAEETEKEIKNIFEKIDRNCQINSLKVINAFQKHNLSEMHFNTSTGYGIGEAGRDKIEDIYSEIMQAEDSLVRTQLISGTHALAVTLFALLRPQETMISITGAPYDTLQTVIGIGKEQSKSSLKSFDIKYEEIDLLNNDFDTEKIIMVDNCYGEFVEEKEPLEVGADIIVGSLMKNLGGGIATSGAYISGKKELITLCAERLTSPGIGKEIGPSLNQNVLLLKGLYFAPSVVASALKTAVFASRMLEKLGYDVDPKYDEKRADIVQTVNFGKEDKLIKYCQGIQQGSPIDANAMPEPSDMGGYDDKVIMAAGTFTQGSTIELSCDGPIRPPYIAYMQGGLTYEYGKYGIIKAIDKIQE